MRCQTDWNVVGYLRPVWLWHVATETWLNVSFWSILIYCIPVSCENSLEIRWNKGVNTWCHYPYTLQPSVSLLGPPGPFYVDTSCVFEHLSWDKVCSRLGAFSSEVGDSSASLYFSNHSSPLCDVLAECLTLLWCSFFHAIHKASLSHYVKITHGIKKIEMRIIYFFITI